MLRNIIGDIILTDEDGQVLDVDLDLIGAFADPVQQDPAGQGHANRAMISFGPGGTTDNGEFTVDATGLFTTNPQSLGKQYLMEAVLRVGRMSNPGVAIPMIRLMYAPDGNPANAFQFGFSASSVIDDSTTVWREAFSVFLSPVVGSVFFMEFARDEAGNNDGSMLAAQPTGSLLANGWTFTPAKLFTISKLSAIQP